MSSTNTNKEEFKILDPRDHARSRPGMYVGNTSYHERERYILGKWQKARYVPALLKLIDEILDNCLDEAIRTDFKHANIINVSIEGNLIEISDNGRGIPQDEITTPTGEKLLRPAAAWTVTNAGTSFGENRTTIGSHGLGSALVNYFSKSFNGKTWQNGSQVIVDSKDGCNKAIKDNPKIKKSDISKKDSGTIVKFVPDISLFENENDGNLDSLIEDLVMDRLAAMAICFPKITFKYNKKKIGQSQFTKYIKNYGDSNIVFGNGFELQVGIVSSDDGYRANGYVNGVHTIDGGAYSDYIMNELSEELIPMIKRKHKINVTKLMIKNHIGLLSFVNSFENPKFDSQTKERLTNSVAEVKSHFSKFGNDVDFKKIAKKVLSTEEIIEPIIQAELAKRLAAEKRAETKAQNKLKRSKVAKHVRANKAGGSLYLVEGDSAGNDFIEVRDNAIHGCLPLRGVVLNTWNEKVTKILANKELADIISCMELNISDPDSVANTYYDDIRILVDADHDGLGHISPLLLSFFYRFWPKLFEQGKIKIVKSPIMIISQKGQKDIWAYEYDEAHKLKDKYPKANFRYIKGLGSLDLDEYSRVVNEPVLQTIKIDDPKKFDLMFDKKDSEPRKDLIRA